MLAVRVDGCASRRNLDPLATVLSRFIAPHNADLMVPLATPFVPPLRDGVAASRVGVHRHFARLDAFLADRFAQVADWPQRLARGDVLDTAGFPAAADQPVAPGDLFWYWRDPPPEPPVPGELTVLHQDDLLIVVDKPHFLPVTPGGRHLHETALVKLRRLTGIATLAPMHRLDRETAGVLVFTVQPARRHAYQALLARRQVHKVYEAVAPWRADLALPLVARHRLQERPGDAFMQMEVVDGEPNAETHIDLISRLPNDGGSSLAHYRLTPVTGRKHQLRIQLSTLGIPITGDRIYPVLQPDTPAGERPDFCNPLQLLARELAFTDPVTGAARHFSSRRRLERLPG
jgi:tRNA pseudouridine32 synthase/23S rRNA pseudouridine746 synthase